mmetsp:Transcript_46143/g.84541  ORF Transcript_46143/g.84541 Transcript_46143/m.84541 type:complete len:255 (-) Transcript_46143:46-810(-)
MAHDDLVLERVVNPTAIQRLVEAGCAIIAVSLALSLWKSIIERAEDLFLPVEVCDLRAVKVTMLLLSYADILTPRWSLVSICKSTKDTIHGLERPCVGRHYKGDTLVAYDLFETLTSMECMLASIRGEVQCMVRNRAGDGTVDIPLRFSMPHKDQTLWPPLCLALPVLASKPSFPGARSSFCVRSEDVHMITAGSGGHRCHLRSHHTNRNSCCMYSRNQLPCLHNAQSNRGQVCLFDVVKVFQCLNAQGSNRCK